MRILHCCLAAFYIDNYGYQENIITKMHKSHGHDVYILASTETFLESKTLGYVTPSSYVNEDGIKVTRVPYTNLLPKVIARKLRIYKGIKSEICKFQPDIIFMHDAQTLAVFPIIYYIERHPKVRLYIDSHTDFINSARNWFSENILHRIIYRFYVKKTIPFTSKYYGTLPARVKFYIDVYGTPINKTEYLPMGVDDTAVDFSQRDNIRQKIREKLSFNNGDFVIITGGKLDKRKKVLELIKAFKLINRDNLRLLIFGTIQNEIKEEWNELVNTDKDNRIKYIGWLQAKETYKYFFASDIACFPGTHSTLWEEVVGYGIPGIYKKWEGIDHMDRGGNCIILDSTNSENLLHIFLSLLDDRSKYQKLLNNARKPTTTDFFAYSKIAEKAIENII